MNIDFRVKRIFELQTKLDSELAKLLIIDKFQHLDQAPAERIGVILSHRFKLTKWKPYIRKYYAWFAEAYPHSNVGAPCDLTT